MVDSYKSSISPNPIIYFGMPLYNSEKYVADAIESLLSQSYENFKIIAVDDCSGDESAELLRHFASADRRIIFLKNKKRLGMIMNWRKTFAEARRRQADYFAWVSDHDLWDPAWLENHVNVLNKYPQVVLAYPLKTSIDRDGKTLNRESPLFETFGLGKRDRVRATCTKMTGAGNMIYGLFRTAVLNKCNGFPYFSMPDRLLLMQISVHGAFKQIHKFLWHRRYFEDGTGSLYPNYAQLIDRHRSTLFIDQQIPWHSHFPTLGQAIGLFLKFSLRPVDGKYNNAFLGMYMALLHLLTKKRNLKIEVRLALRHLQHKLNTF